MRTRWMLVLVLSALPLAGCEGDRSGACEPCSNASDCEIGLTCQIFRDAASNERNLCGDSSANMICPPQ